MSMTGITSRDGEKRLVLISGRAHPELADDVARELGVELVPTTAYDFANGEIYVRFGESVRGADAFVLQSHATPINRSIMEQLIMVDALKRASAKTITVVLPFYGYARQDKKHRGREPISARLMADLFKTAGADRLMSVDLHAAQTQGFFDGPVDHLWAMPLLVDYVRTRVDATNVAVVSPDAGRIRVAEQWAAKLGGCPLAFIHKTRDITAPNRSVANRVVGEDAGAPLDLAHHAVGDGTVRRGDVPRLVDECQGAAAQLGRPLLGDTDPASVRGDDGDVGGVHPRPHVVHQQRHGPQVVDRPVEEALGLRCVQVDAHQAVGAGRLEQVGHQPGRDRLAATVLLVLAGIPVEREHHRDGLGRRPLERVDHDQLLHDRP